MCQTISLLVFFNYTLYLRKVGSHTSAHTRLLGGSVDRDEDEVSLLDGGINVSGEEQVLATAIKDNLLEARLIDWELVRVPSSNAGRVYVNDGDLDVVALVGDDSAGRTT